MTERNLAQAVRFGARTLVADEPAEQGGEDRGPSPYDLLLGALGACTGMTAQLYARRKGWPLERIRVVLRHRKIYAQDCAECETRDGYLDEIEREIFLEGALDGEQRQRLLQISARCPVGLTLQREVRISDRLG